MKTTLFYFAVFLTLITANLAVQAQSWVSEATQGGFIIKKVVSDTTIASGLPFSYTVYYTIPAGATNVTIADQIPAGVMFLSQSFNNACGTPTVVSPAVNQMGGTYSLSWASVPMGCTGSFTITVAFPNGITCPGASVRNNVCLMGMLAGKNYEFCTGYVNTKALAVNPWHINKYPIGAAWQGGNCQYASSSDTITYQICVYKDVGNTGQLNLVAGVVTDTLPTGAQLVNSNCGATQTGNVITWSVGNMSATQQYNSVCCQFSVYYPSSLFPSGTSITNKATLSGQLGDTTQPCTNFTTQSQQTCVQVISVTDGKLYKWLYTNRQPGCAGQYVIYVSNTGTTPLIINVKDTLPTTLSNYSIGYTWNLNPTLSGGIVSFTDTLAVGQSGYVYINFTIPANATIGSTITNCAYMSLGAGSPPTKVCASFVVDAPASQPCLWKEVCSKQTSYLPGSTFRYRLRIQNIGGLPLTGATLTDQLNPNLEYVGNPSYYISNSWNTACTTNPANPWTGASLSYNSTTNIVTATLDTIPAICQNIFYVSCGMYGTSGAPYYYIEFDVKVRDSSALGNVPNTFSLKGGSLGTTTYTSNIDYVLIVGTVGFSLDKGVKKPTDQTYGSGVTTPAGSTVNYRLKMNSTGTAALRYVTFADLLPRDASPTDSKILNLCGSRGSTGNFDIAYNSFISANPTITQWRNTYTGGLANVNNFLPTGAPGNAFSIGCASTGGTWASGWTALDKNLGSHFGSNSVGSGGATVEFSADVIQGSIPLSGIECNSFAASGWTKHLIQSNIVNFQLAGQSESNTACVTIDTNQHPRPCLEKLEKIDIKCKGKNAAGLVEYSLQIVASSCTPATITISSPDASFAPSTFNFSSSPWTLNTVFAHTSANNPIKIYYSIICEGVDCRDSLMLDLPDCPPSQPKDCCHEFMRKIEKPQISWLSDGSVNLSASMFAGPVAIKKFSATIVSAQLKFQNTPWQRIFGDILGGGLVVAPAVGPQLLSLYSREAIWGTGECIDWNKGAKLGLKMLFPSVGSKAGTDSLRFAIRYSFTNCDCVTCDTVIFYTIVRKWKPNPWEVVDKFNKLRGTIGDGSIKSDKSQAENPTSTSIVMNDENAGSLWIISPNDPDNDVVVTGLEVYSDMVQLGSIKYGATNGTVLNNTGFVGTNIKSGDNAPIELRFNNSAELMKFPIYVRYIYTIEDFDDTLETEPIVYIARSPGANADQMGIDPASTPAKVASYALYINNTNGYAETISAISIKPQGNLKILAVGPPSSNDGRTFLIPHLLEDGSYIITVANQGIAGVKPTQSAKPIYLTLSGVDEANAEIEFTTFDENTQAISEGVLRLSDPISGVNDNEGRVTNGAFFNPIAPNPAKNFVTISFTMNEISNGARLSIVDLAGKEVLNVLENVSLDKGTHVYGVSVSNLPSGAHFIVLRTERGIITQSLSITR
jgi:uncharacterized repeat protein (TIGR01451 family)